MPQTTQCQSCRAILNLPSNVAAGKRLRCPKCGFKFAVSVADASSESTVPAPLDADPGSSYNLPKPGGLPDELPLLSSDRDLRETFELPFTSGRDAERAGAAPAAAVSDAASLFRDDPAPRRRKAAGDARTNSRRCSNCGGLVPQGMSICVSCGVDQESGMRVGLEDDLAPPPPPAPSGPPIHVAVVGGLLGVAALTLLILSLIQSVGGTEGWQNYGWLCLAFVSGFSIYAVVQFIRLKTVKLLMIALALGVVIDLMVLIAKPLVMAHFAEAGSVVTQVEVPSNDPDDAGVHIKSAEEQLDKGSFVMGVTFLVVYAALSVYLMSPAVKKPFQRANALGSW